MFSPLGDLISLPAIMVSTNGGAQANFGFVIQFRSGDTAPKGNLQYQDHGADVRIKATSYDTADHRRRSPCGAEHPRHLHRHRPGQRRRSRSRSKWTTAASRVPVLLPTPSASQTDSYSNGGPLVGGNIQIH